MCKEDAEKAMRHFFKSNFSMLKFSKGQEFLGMDKDGDCCLTIQGEFKGTGRYEFAGKVKLCAPLLDGATCSSLYSVSGYVTIGANEDEEPIPDFEDSISITKA